MRQSSYLANAIRWLLILTAFTPLIVSNATIYPFIFPKIVFYRVLVELSLALALFYFLILPRDKAGALLLGLGAKVKIALISPAVIFISLFLFSLILSTIFAENTYRAFWGDIERGVGVFGFIHFYTFLILALSFFENKDWDIFFKLSLVVGFIVIFFAFLEYFGLHFLFLKPQTKARPESLIGNAAFLATHLIFLATFAFIVFRNASEAIKISVSRARQFWRYFPLIVLASSLIAIFLTGTRGAILGLGAGIIALFLYFSMFSDRKYLRFATSLKLNLRFLSLMILALIVVFSGIFWVTRSNSFWQQIPGLDRLAKTAALDVNDASTQFRLITWQLSWDAFKERPLFGWGPENYIVAYEKYYDPQYALYGETWLDRAHNTFFDLLVMQGIFGTFTYFGLLFFLYYLVIQRVGKKDFYLGGFLVAWLTAYFVQNLVIFDQVVSYAAFFGLLGFILYFTKTELSVLEQKTAKTESTAFLKPVSILLISGVIFIIAFYNIVPYSQAIAFKKSPGVSANATEVEQAIKDAISPYNFAQFNIRSQGIDTIYLGAYFDNEEYVSNIKFRSLGQTLIEMIGDLVKKEPFDVRTHIRLVEMLNSYSIGMTEEDVKKTGIFVTAENLMRDAVRRAPRRQETYYHLAFNLAAQKKFDEAVEVARYAIDLEPKVARAHYHLGLVLALAGRNTESQEALAQAEELAPNFDRFLATDLNNIAIFYKTWGFADKYANLIYRTLIKINENRIGHAFAREHYEEALRYYISTKNAQRAVPIAEYLGRSFPDLKEDMAKIKILIERGEWPDRSIKSTTTSKQEIPAVLLREYYENELRRHILNKDKENAMKAAEYLLKNYYDYAIDQGIGVVLGLVKKEKWEILHNL